MSSNYSRPIVIVSGLGRCGSSLTMQMLQACGLNCAGEFPAFEPEESNMLYGKLSAEWMSKFEAVKILDPQRGKMPAVDAVIIWLERNPAQQAMSQVKFVRMVAGMDVKEGAAAKICKSLGRERPQAIRRYFGYRQIHVAFEDAILNTPLFCHQIANFMSPWWQLDEAKMAACVKPRENGPKCQSGMEIEMELCA